MRTDNMIQVDMYFGLSIAEQHNNVHGTRVTHAEWCYFLERWVDAEFEGYSISAIEGRWKGEGEDSMKLTFITTATEMSKVRRLARVYRCRYSQDAVLVTTVALNTVEFM